MSVSGRVTPARTISPAAECGGSGPTPAAAGLWTDVHSAMKGSDMRIFAILALETVDFWDYPTYDGASGGRGVSSVGQSTCLTSRGSLVRARHRPPLKTRGYVIRDVAPFSVGALGEY